MDNSNQFTSQVYSYIRNFDYAAAVNVLETQLQRFPRSRAALSLLGYCYYHMQDYELATETYSKLVKLYPHITEYRTYCSQSLLKIGEIDEARQTEFRSQFQHDEEQQQRTQRELMLQVNIKFEEGDLNACRSILNRCVEEDPETMFAQATLYTKENKYEEALELYTETINVQGYQAEVAYNIALCYYMLGEYDDALETVQEIITRGVEEYPEFGPNKSEFEEKMDVSNTIQLQESFLVEAYNLKATIEFTQNEGGGVKKARKTLNEMPQRKEEELDPVTLHNQGLINFDSDANGCIERLKFLLANPPFPPETFGNLLVLYCKLGHYDLCADILADNSHLTYDYLSEELYEFLDTLIMSKASPDEAYGRFDELIKKYSLELRKLSKDLESNHQSNNDDDDETLCKKKQIQTIYDDTMNNSFVPILMAQASMYWEKEDYHTIEQLFRKSADLCVDINEWRLNVAHTFFVQHKFKDAIRYYESFVKDNRSEKLLSSITPIVLSNLCVSYIMTNQNEAAEEIMKQIENEEGAEEEEEGKDQQQQHRLQQEEEHEKTNDENEDRQDQHEKKHHSCIINLVIGTLYCEKGNFEFGISRICKSLDPMEEKLGADTWFYTKRCLLALMDYMAKERILLKRESFQDIIDFLRVVYKHGKEIDADFGWDDEIKVSTSMNSSMPTVASEVLHVKKLLCKLMK